VAVDARAHAEAEDARSLPTARGGLDELSAARENRFLFADIAVGEKEDVAMTPGFDRGAEGLGHGARHLGAAPRLGAGEEGEGVGDVVSVGGSGPRKELPRCPGEGEDVERVVRAES